jgi:hypothetical protein
VSSEDAETALATMQREEELTAGPPMYGRIFRMHEQDAAKALRVLVRREEAEDAFGPEPVDYGALPRREYFETVYKPWRAEKKPKTWITEEGRWRRILPVMGGRRLREVDAHVVADYLDALRVVRDELEQPAARRRACRWWSCRLPSSCSGRRTRPRTGAPGSESPGDTVSPGRWRSTHRGLVRADRVAPRSAHRLVAARAPYWPETSPPRGARFPFTPHVLHPLQAQRTSP